MLPAIIAQLEQLIAQVEASEPVEESGARLDISTHSKSGHEYARLRNGSMLKSCSRVGSAQYLEVLATLQRYDKIIQLTQALEALTLAQEISVTVPVLPKIREISPVAAKPKAVPRKKN